MACPGPSSLILKSGKVDSSILSLTTSSEALRGDPAPSQGAKRGAKELLSLFMTDTTARRRGHGEDAIYFDATKNRNPATLVAWRGRARNGPREGTGRAGTARAGLNPGRGGCQDAAGARGRGKEQRAVSLEIKRLHLGATPGDTERWPVHGFVVTYPGGAALVDTGVGGPPDLIRDWEVVNVTAADALVGLGLVPGRHRPGHQHTPALRPLRPERGVQARGLLPAAGRA